MKALFAALVLAWCVSGVASADTRALADFTKITATAGTDVRVEIGPAYHVEVEGREAAQIVTRVERDRLIVEPVRRWGWHGRRDAIVRVSMPQVEALDVSSGAHIEASGVAGGDLSLNASSGAVMNVAGACGGLRVDTSSGANINARELQCETGRVSASSGSRASLTLAVRLDLDASSGADVSVSGAAINGDISLSSGGSLHRR
jgi:Putative auto-transporter adhesin, head GIN domain